jgi:hypothetical protein
MRYRTGLGSEIGHNEMKTDNDASAFYKNDYSQYGDPNFSQAKANQVSPDGKIELAMIHNMSLPSILVHSERQLNE